VGGERGGQVLIANVSIESFLFFVFLHCLRFTIG